MKSPLFIIIGMIAFVLNSYAQREDYSMKQHVVNVKHGNVLLRINDYKSKYEAMMKYDSLAAIEEKQKNKERYEEIYSALLEYFTFPDNLYFYYSSDANEVLNNKNYNLIYSDFDEPASNFDDTLPTYLIFFERKNWNLNYDQLSLIWYYLSENGPIPLKKPFPFNQETRIGHGFFDLHDYFDKAAEEMNANFEYKYKKYSKN